MKIYFTFDSKENKLKIIICYCTMNNLNLKFFIFLHHIIFFFIYFILSRTIDEQFNSFVQFFTSYLSLIIHLISMIFMNLKITISYIKIYNFKFKSIKIIFIIIYHTKFKFQWKFINDLSLFPNRIVSQNLKKKKTYVKT